MVSFWCIAVPVIAEVGWLVAVGPRLFRGHQTAARLGRDEEPIGRVANIPQYLSALAWMVYHWPVFPIMALALVTSPPVWVRFGLLMGCMAVTPIAYWLLLSWGIRSAFPT